MAVHFGNRCGLDRTLVNELVPCTNPIMGRINPHIIRSSCIIAFSVDFFGRVFKCSSDLFHLCRNNSFGCNTTGPR